MSTRNASPVLLARLRAVKAELKELDHALQRYGDRDAGDAVKRARRELENVEAKGTFAVRDQHIS